MTPTPLQAAREALAEIADPIEAARKRLKPDEELIQIDAAKAILCDSDRLQNIAHKDLSAIDVELAKGATGPSPTAEIDRLRAQIGELTQRIYELGNALIDASSDREIERNTARAEIAARDVDLECRGETIDKISREFHEKIAAVRSAMLSNEAIQAAENAHGSSEGACAMDWMRDAIAAALDKAGL